MSQIYNILHEFKKNINIDKLEQDEKNISIDNNSSDLISYPEFIKYFEELKDISKSNIVIGINFTYGWMPTIFEFGSQDFDEIAKILNHVKKGIMPTIDKLAILKTCFNNSLVGTSKLLHFINPNNFAIWDSNVYRYLTQKEPYTYRLNEINSYLEYLKFCKWLTNKEKFPEIQKSLEKKVGYEMTPYRSVELIMFVNGKELK